jgi:hypothetical protein
VICLQDTTGVSVRGFPSVNARIWYSDAYSDQIRHRFRFKGASVLDPLPPPTFHAHAHTPPSQSCPRKRAGVACNERTTVAVGNSCSAPKMLVFACAVVIESGAINVGNVSHSRRLRGDSHWLFPASCCRWTVSPVAGIPLLNRFPSLSLRASGADIGKSRNGNPPQVEPCWG